VIVDCSAALNDPDVQIACAAADAVILAIRKNRSRHGAAQRTVNGLSNVGAVVIGAVATFSAKGEECSGYRDWTLLPWPRVARPSVKPLEAKAG
jgi:Mrp family chromosome partitioning ATPase